MHERELLERIACELEHVAFADGAHGGRPTVGREHCHLANQFTGADLIEVAGAPIVSNALNHEATAEHDVARVARVVLCDQRGANRYANARHRTCNGGRRRRHE